MGYTRHDAVIITTWDKRVWEALAPLVDGRTVIDCGPSECNSYRSFFMPPDGSKEGWAESDVGDSRRANVAAAARVAGWCDIVTVSYGADYASEGQFYARFEGGERPKDHDPQSQRLDVYLRAAKP